MRSMQMIENLLCEEAALGYQYSDSPLQSPSSTVLSFAMPYSIHVTN